MGRVLIWHAISYFGLAIAMVFGALRSPTVVWFISYLTTLADRRIYSKHYKNNMAGQENRG